MGDRSAFVARYGAVYTAGAWVAKRAWDGGAVEGEPLSPRFAAVVERAAPDLREALVRAEPCVSHLPMHQALKRLHELAQSRLNELSAPPPAEVETIAFEALSSIVRTALERTGADDATVGAIHDTVMAAERAGIHSHGMFRVPGYVKALNSGLVSKAPVVTIKVATPALVKADGGGGFAPVAYRKGLPVLAEAAAQSGAAVLALTHTYHLAAMWHEVEYLAEKGLAAFACTANFPYLAPHGGTRPIFGTNPIAFAYPYRPHHVAFDFATSAMARGDIMVAMRDGKPLPMGLGVGPDGKPTNDPAAILKGAQLPFGAHKGSALALMVELLCGGTAGDNFSDEVEPDASGAPPGAVFILALSPERIGGAGITQRAAAFLDRLAAEPGVRLPGARRHQNRSATDAVVAAAVMNELRTLAGQAP